MTSATAGRLRAISTSRKSKSAGMFTRSCTGHRRPFQPWSRSARASHRSRARDRRAVTLQAGPPPSAAPARVCRSSSGAEVGGPGGWPTRRRAGHAKHTSIAERAEQQDRPQQPQQLAATGLLVRAPPVVLRSPLAPLPSTSAPHNLRRPHAPSHRSSHCDAIGRCSQQINPACGSIPGDRSRPGLRHACLQRRFPVPGSLETDMLPPHARNWSARRLRTLPRSDPDRADASHSPARRGQ